MARRLFWAEKFRMPVHSAPARPFATCSAHDQSSGSDFSNQYGMVFLSRSGRPRPLGLNSANLGIEQVRAPVAEEVETKDVPLDCPPGIDHEPRRLLDVEASLREDVAPAWNVRWDADAEERERRLRQHR